MASAFKILNLTNTRHRTQMHQRDVAQLKDENPDHAQHDAEQNVAAHQRIAESPGEQAAPRDHGVWPALPHPRFEGKVEHAGKAGKEQGCAGGEHKQAKRSQSGHKMRSAQPEKHLKAEHYDREANGPFAVSASAAVIAASHIEGAKKAADQQGDAEDLGNLFPQSLVGLLDALRLGPIT